jgi:Ca2+-binding EF-hand superfamily protein
MLNTESFDRTFELIDVDKDGRITADELKSLVSTLGGELSSEAAKTMLGFIDTDSDGTISREELQKYLIAKE